MRDSRNEPRGVAEVRQHARHEAGDSERVPDSAARYRTDRHRSEVPADRLASEKIPTAQRCVGREDKSRRDGTSQDGNAERAQGSTA